MGETPEDIEEIRRRKKRRLRANATARDSAVETPEDDHSDPVRVEGADHLGRLVADHRVVLVEFHADWCGPCRMLEPTLETVAADTPATVAKVDADAHGGLAGQYGIQGIPALLLFVDGDLTERLVGVQDEATLRDLVDVDGAV